MMKKILAAITSIISIFFLINTPIVFATAKGAGDICKPGVDTCPAPNYSCLQYDSKTFLCLSKILGAGEICNPNDLFSTVCIPGYSCQLDDASQAYLCQKTTDKGAGEICKPGVDTCIPGFFCQLDDETKTNLCIKNAAIGTFGKIKVPDTLGGLIKNNPTGAGAIGQFLSNFIVLLFSIAGIALIFMLVWGALEWLTSGGDKEKIASAQKRILNAIIGIILFAVAFAIIRILGVFTGFTFFKEPDFVILQSNNQGIIIRCNTNGHTVYYPKDPIAACQGP